MRSFRSPLLLAAILSAALATNASRRDAARPCLPPLGAGNPDCQGPLEDITAIIPGFFYVARLPCVGCVTAQNVAGAEVEPAHEESSLLFIVRVSKDSHDILLNSEPITPPLPLNRYGRPPRIIAPQILPEFSQADLDRSIECAKDLDGAFDNYETTSCLPSVVGDPKLDYDYGAVETETEAEAEEEGVVEWTITFDAVGGKAGPEVPYALYNSTGQKMLQIRIAGKPEIDDNAAKQKENIQTSPGLFDTIATPEQPKPKYTYQILDVQLVDRSYKFPETPKPNLWRKVLFYLGFDPTPKDGHIVYIASEWDLAKKGTLKNAFLHVQEFWNWTIFTIVLFSVFGGSLFLYVLWKFVRIIRLQPELRQRRQIRRRRQIYHDNEEEEEAGGLLDGQEDYEDGEYGLQDLKPKALPSKPLPEKPLPEVPLLDDT